jgi:hypothetical protein
MIGDYSCEQVKLLSKVPLKSSSLQKVCLLKTGFGVLDLAVMELKGFGFTVKSKKTFLWTKTIGDCM